MRTRSGGAQGDIAPGGPPRTRPPRLLFGVVAGAVAVVVGVALVVFFMGGDDKESGAKQPAVGNGLQVVPTIYTPMSPDNGRASVNRLDRRAKDPQPVAGNEVFTAETKSLAYRDFVFNRVDGRVSDDCRSVSWGQRVQTELRTYGCTQIVRGAYLSADKRFAAQFIAINLDRHEGANQLVRTLEVGKGAGFVFPLAAPGVEKFGTGFSAAYALVQGHYAIVCWVQRNGGGQPKNVSEMIDLSIPIERQADFVWARQIRAGEARS